MPLFISVAAFIWIFGVVDGLTTPLYDRLLGRRIPGLGTLSTALAIVLVGARGDQRDRQAGAAARRRAAAAVPVFRTIYSPVKQLIAAFSPDNESGFKRVVMVEDARRGLRARIPDTGVHVDRGQGPEALLAVYVPTNHLYLGDIVICERGRATLPGYHRRGGIRIFLTGGMALPPCAHGDRRTSI